MPSEKITGVRMIAVEYMKKTLRQYMRLQRSSSRAEENAGEKQKFGARLPVESADRLS